MWRLTLFLLMITLTFYGFKLEANLSQVDDSLDTLSQKDNIEKEPDYVIKTVELTILVINKEQQNPIENAKIILTYSDNNEFERRTNNTGSATLTNLPYGAVDIDIIASGMQSYGGSIMLNESHQSLKFTLTPRRITSSIQVSEE